MRLFERLSEIKKNGVFRFERSSLDSEIFKFLCHVNDEVMQVKLRSCDH